MLRPEERVQPNKKRIQPFKEQSKKNCSEKQRGQRSLLKKTSVPGLPNEWREIVGAFDIYFKFVSHILHRSFTSPYFSKIVFILMQSTHTLTFGLCYTTECRIAHDSQEACETWGNALPLRICQDHIFLLLHWNLHRRQITFDWYTAFLTCNDVGIEIIPKSLCKEDRIGKAFISWSPEMAAVRPIIREGFIGVLLSKTQWRERSPNISVCSDLPCTNSNVMGTQCLFSRWSYIDI